MEIGANLGVIVNCQYSTEETVELEKKPRYQSFPMFLHALRLIRHCKVLGQRYVGGKTMSALDYK